MLVIQMVSVSNKLNPFPTRLCHMIYYHCDKLVGIGLWQNQIQWRNHKTRPQVIYNSLYGNGAPAIFTLKVSYFGMCSKMQIIPIKNLNIKKVVPQFLWFFRLKCWFKGQIISRIHLRLPNAYKLMCFDRNINGNSDVKFFEWDYWPLHWRKNLTLVIKILPL